MASQLLKSLGLPSSFLGVCSATVVLFAFVYTLRMIYRRTLHPLARFPGPFLNSVTNARWHYQLFQGKAHLENQEWHQSYGPIVRISPDHLSFADPVAIKDIYGFALRESLRLPKDPKFFTPEVDGTYNIVNETNGPEHSRMRKMLSNAFSNSGLLSNDDIVIRRVDEFLNDVISLDKKNNAEGVDIKTLFSYVTFNIMGEMALGDSFEALCSQDEYKYKWADVIMRSSVMNDVMRAVAVIPGLVDLLSIYIPKHFKETMYRHFEYSSKHTHVRTKSRSTTATETRKDFVHYMLNSKGFQHQIAPTPELTSQVLVIMMAGTVTTATSLTAVTYYLLQHPAIVEKLRSELRSKFTCVEEMTSKALMDCEYLNAIIMEGLRINPPAGAAHLPRVVPKGGAQIMGTWVPEGTSVSVHPFSLVMNPQNFHEPRKFIPERWLASEPEGQKGDRLDASVPFSHGPRGCIGKNLAHFELRMVLAKMFWKWDIQMSNSTPIKSWIDESTGYTLWRNPPLNVRISERKS